MIINVSPWLAMTFGIYIFKFASDEAVYYQASKCILLSKTSLDLKAASLQSPRIVQAHVISAHFISSLALFNIFWPTFMQKNMPMLNHR